MIRLRHTGIPYIIAGIVLLGVLLALGMVRSGKPFSPTPAITATEPNGGLSQPTPGPRPLTPTAEVPAESLYLPRQQNQNRPHSATNTPTSGPTPSPASPTATPAATPFPPGPPSKLGIFVGRNDPQVFTLLQTGNLAVVKTLEYDPNFVAEIKKTDPNVFLVARYTPLPQPDLSAWDPEAAARAFAELILPLATEPRRLAAIDCWEAYNEPVVANEKEMASLARFEATRVRLLAAAGVRSCVGNFGAGNPPLDLWPAFYPALEAARDHGGYLALHEYAAPYLWFGTDVQNPLAAAATDEGWLTLRYRKVYRQYLQPAGLALPLVITEAGVDGLVHDRPGPASARGWQDFVPFWQEQGWIDTSAFGFYMEQLAWYDAELAQDDYVIGAAIYALAASQGWPSYEIGGPWLHIFAQYLAVHPPR